MMVLPLPAFVLDVFFTFNIAISVLVLLVAVNTQKTLDFSVFPTVLLVTTLLRLSLNVASTRIVMLEGHNGPDAAGKVIDQYYPLHTIKRHINFQRASPNQQKQQILFSERLHT